MQKVETSEPADADMFEIWRFVAENRSSVDAADRIIDQFEEAFERLAEFPEIGHFREDIADQPMRFWHVHSWLIAYVIEGDILFVSRVFHSARDLKL